MGWASSLLVFTIMRDAAMPLPNIASWQKESAVAVPGFATAQISNLHIGSTIKRDYVQVVVGRVNGLNPDVIAMTAISLIRRFIYPEARIFCFAASQTHHKSLTFLVCNYGSERLPRY